MYLLRSCVLLALGTTALSAQETSYRLRITTPVGPAQETLLRAEFDVVANEEGGVDVIVLPEELQDFRRLGLTTRLVARGRPFRDIAAASLAPDDRYFTSAEILAEIDKVAASHPAIAMRIDLSALPGASKTHGGRSIYALKVSDNVQQTEREPAIVLASQHHARELNSPVMVIETMKRVLAGYATDPQLKALVDGYELLFVPCVNPDGTDYVWTNDNMWRKNRRDNGNGSFGVDNNRNYPFLWGQCGASSNSGSSTYKGPSPGSEPENRTMMAVQAIYRPELYLDVHSSGQEVLFTYAPCATVNSSIRAMIDRYMHALRTPMNYANRLPSASGEAPEYHWSQGTMGFLTEVMTSFQPPYVNAVAESARVHAGFYAALTTWRPAVRGHVTSIHKQQPIAATIRYTPSPFVYGEVNASRARDGRYAMWLPPGTYQVTWSAPGYRSVTMPVQVTGYDQPKVQDVVMVPDMPAATMGKSGSDRIGTTTLLTYTSPGDVGEVYWVILAAGATPGIPVGAGRVVPLNFDPVFLASVQPNVLLQNNTGTLPATGAATARFPIPNLPGLVGIEVYAAGVTQNNEYLSTVKNFSPALRITIQR